VLSLIWSGVVTGCLYALGALGLVMIYKSSKVVNFSHGNLAGLSAFCVFGLTAGSLSWPWWFAVAVATVVALAVALLTWALLLPIVSRSDLTATIATVGVGLILQGTVLVFFGSDIVSLDLPIPQMSVKALGINVTSYDVTVVLSTLLLVGLLFIIVDGTRIGVAFRATASNPFASRVCGLSINRIHLFSWATGALLGVASALLIVPTTFLSPTAIESFMIQAFAAAVLGGFSSLPGTIIGGILVGILVNLFIYYVSSEFTNTFLLALILIALPLFPEGILSRRERTRA